MNRLHQAQLRRTRIQATVVVLLTLSSAYLLLFSGLLIPGWGLAPLSIILVIGAFLTFAYSTILLAKPHCVLHPYFERRLPEEGAKSMFGGTELSKSLDEIDDYLASKSMKTVSHFGFKDGFTNSACDWHNASEAIQILEEVANNFTPLTEKQSGDIGKILNSLRIAEKHDIRFCFHLRFADGASGQEFDVREGSYW